MRDFLVRLETALREIGGGGKDVMLQLIPGNQGTNGWESYCTAEVYGEASSYAFVDGLTLWETLASLLEAHGYAELAEEVRRDG